MRRLIRITLGIIFILLGLAGLVLPLLQGWLFLALGVVILARDVKFFARLEHRVITRFPKAGRVMDYLTRAFPILAK
jgi:uncharacterized membrane protein YbaN (DUF454 family)